MSPRPSRPHGFVLVAVLVVVMLGSMVALSLMYRLRAEETAVSAGAGGEQAWAAAMSGLQSAIQFLIESEPGSLEWQNNPELFKEQFVWDDGADRWFFTLYTAGDPFSEEIDYGLSDESSRLHLNEATEAMLEKIPRLTTARIHALLDFRDADDLARPEGAEQEHYDGLAVPYKIHNGPFRTVDELLLVRGFGPQLVYGEDANMNFRLDPNEDDGDELHPPDNSDGELDRGLRRYFTVSSYEYNLDNDGNERMNLNDPDEMFYDVELSETTLAYIDALHQNNIVLDHPAELLEARRTFPGQSGSGIELESGVGKAELPKLLDLYTTTYQRRFEGLINVNTASIRILSTVPGIDESLAESIVAARRYLTPEQRRTIAWLYEDDVVDAELFKRIAPYLTARSFQFRCHVLGYGLPSGRYRIAEAIIDLAGEVPAIVYLRDLTRVGIPFPITPRLEEIHG
jgi:DNA uptake protein ComE-like DNA-binding protein